MDTSPALLLLLALGLCCPGIHGHTFVMKVRSHESITKLWVGDRLELECQTDRESGAFWIRQDKSGTLHFIVYINSMSRLTFEGNEKTSPRFEASKDHNSYRLVVKFFTPQDQGNYFCALPYNQMLSFSPGQPAFLPVISVTAPSTPGPSTPGHTTQCGTTGKDSSLKTPDPDRTMQEELNSFCLVFLWIPLTGLCLLLLQLLAMTTVLCRRKAHHNPLQMHLCPSGR